VSDNSLRTTIEVCGLLGCDEWRIEQAIRRREIPRPPLLGRTRTWTPELVESLRAALERRGVVLAKAAAPAGSSS
jgi:hypothetical protein